MSTPDIAERPEVKEATAHAQSLVTFADSCRVTTAEEYVGAANVLQTIKAAQKRLETERTNITRPLDQAKAAVMAFFNPWADKLKTAEGKIKRAQVAYDDEQRRKAQEEQRRRDEEARRERERLETEARETARRAEEAAAQARAQADAERAAGNAHEAAKLERKADRIEGRAEEKATNLQAAATAVVAPIVQVELPKVAGIKRVEHWKYVVEDESKLPREYMTRDDKKIGAVVRALKGDTKIPGVRVYPESGLAAGAAT